MVAESTKSFWTCVLAASVVKLLMLKSYRSTDFEVHRNWLAITYSQPLQKWYYEETSEWTLDYPPFFAYFQWILAQLAQFFDPEMLNVKNLKYASNMTIFFQKLSVVVMDLVLAQSVLECSNIMKLILPKSKSKSPDHLFKLFALIFINGGLFLVDHIHFQYNGYLFGILMLSVARICKGECYKGAFLFAILLCHKHIFLYIAPAYGIYLLRAHCIKADHRGIPTSINLVPLLTFGAIVASVLATAFGPFYQHIPQIIKRLFPFKRGLSHAYWAPNAWAAYNSLDLVLSFGMKHGKSGTTSGLVGESSFAVLPQVQPLHTFLITLAVMMPILWKLWRDPSPQHFLYAVTLTGWSSFMFGYHVHEKAVLNVIIPFALISELHPELFLMTLAAGTVSLFPLLFSPFEIVLKGIVTVLHLCLVAKTTKCSLSSFHLVYVLGLVPVFLFENLGNYFLSKLPFLPLVVVSDYTLLGIGYCYVTMYLHFMKSDGIGGGKPRKSEQSERAAVHTDPRTSPRILRRRKTSS